MREAANGSQLRRNFAGLDLLLVPEMFWDFSTSQVLVMERMTGVPISQVETLRSAGVDIKKLAREGVEIFFTQVFRDGFFHADMHPGNIQVSLDPNTFGRYVALDFGIVGALSDFDKNYLAQNFLAFFKRDYHRVATLHLESGWVPPETRVEELESAIRAVCEPYFDRALKDISLGQVLMRLFSTSRRFNVEIQPQLVLLQKTMLNVEGLGRSLDPGADLWKTAKPYLERWMTEQIGLRGWYERFKVEAPQWSKTLPQLPRLIHHAMAARHDAPRAASEELMRQILVEQKRTNRLMQALLIFGLAVGVGRSSRACCWRSRTAHDRKEQGDVRSEATRYTVSRRFHDARSRQRIVLGRAFRAWRDAVGIRWRARGFQRVRASARAVRGVDSRLRQCAGSRVAGRSRLARACDRFRRAGGGGREGAARRACGRRRAGRFLCVPAAVRRAVGVRARVPARCRRPCVPAMRRAWPSCCLLTDCWPAISS